MTDRPQDWYMYQVQARVDPDPWNASRVILGWIPDIPPDHFVTIPSRSNSPELGFRVFLGVRTRR